MADLALLRREAMASLRPPQRLDLADWVEANVVLPSTRPDLPDLYGIGGHVDWTVVAANGAETLRIWELPDEIGEPIDPAREGREPGWLEAA